MDEIHNWLERATQDERNRRARIKGLIAEHTCPGCMSTIDLYTEPGKIDPTVTYVKCHNCDFSYLLG